MKIRENKLVSLKGSTVLKIVAFAAVVLLFLSVETPRSMWEDQKIREDIAHQRMIDMSDCQIIYMQENDAFESDLKKVYDFVMSNTMPVNPPEFTTEIMTLDTSAIRLSFMDLKHVKDLEVVKEGDNKVTVSLIMFDEKLGLKGDKYILTSATPIEVITEARGIKLRDYRDFISKSAISIEIVRAQEEQVVNIARYILSDVDNSSEVYLCPSTNDPFDVEFNLSAKVYMKVKFFRGENKGKYLAGLPSENLLSNEKVRNYFLELAKLKSERKRDDIVREYEFDGDSTLSTKQAKDSLFSIYFADYIKNAAKKVEITDSIANSLSATNLTKDEEFSDIKRFDILFSKHPGETVIAELEKNGNKVALGNLNFVYETGFVSVDTISVIIQSPIKEGSEFKGYDRSILQQQFLFGVKDDKNHGYVDNDRPSWKKN